MINKPCALLAFAMLVSSTTGALADSCWNHNGSVMRLQASGNHREFFYENPKASIRGVGVRRGTLLFDGEKSGNWYSGTARVFSNGCAPLEYPVAGPVASNQLKVTVTGTREVYSQCQPTGRMKTDTLVFTWIGDC